MANLRGRARNDTIYGTINNDTIDGLAGDDYLDGREGNDTIYGGAGNDTLIGGLGNDNLYGGDDNDVLNGGLQDDILDGGTGVDTASYAGIQAHNFINLATGTATQQWSAQTVGRDTLISIENVIGGDYSDYITGSAVNNVIFSGAGTDTIYASLGIDALDGGAGNDLVDFGAANAAVTASMASNSYLFGANSGSMTNFEAVFGGSFSDQLTGNSGDNKLDGRAGSDVLAGGLGNDQIWGGAGADRLIADGGNDQLSGNYSFDSFGDRAADIFEIRTNAGVVTITDFQQGEDKLDLTAFGFDSQGISPNWTGSSALQGSVLVLTLTSLQGQVVEIRLNGVTAGEAFSASDMIGGSPSLEYHQAYPLNGGNGIADIFVLNPLGGDVVINGFENGLDRLDISSFIHNGWGGHLANAPDGSVQLNFSNGTNDFTVTLTGVSVGQIDATDYII